MASIAQIITIGLCCIQLSLGHPRPQQQQSEQAYQAFRQYQVPASTRLLPNNVNDGVRYGQQPLVYVMPQSSQQYLYQQDQGAAAVGPSPADQGGYVESFIGNFASGAGYYPFASDNRPVAQPQPAAGEPQKPERLHVGLGALNQQQLLLEQQAATQLMQEEAERQKYMLQYYQQQRPNNFVYFSLPQQQQQPLPAQPAGLFDRTQQHGLRPANFAPNPLTLQRLQIRSGQEQNNASSEIQESQEATQSPQTNEEVGPSIAQAKPQAISVAGPGGVAAAAPVGTAVVGPGGMALSAPSATALAGTRPKPGQGPHAAASRLRQAVRYLY